MTDYMHDKLPLSFKNMFTINRNKPNARTPRQSNRLNIGRCDSQFSENYLFTISQLCGTKLYQKTFLEDRSNDLSNQQCLKYMQIM